MWKLIIIVMLTGNAGMSTGGAHIEIREINLKSEAACMAAIKTLTESSELAKRGPARIEPYKVRAFCFRVNK